MNKVCNSVEWLKSLTSVSIMSYHKFLGNEPKEQKGKLPITRDMHISRRWWRCVLNFFTWLQQSQLRPLKVCSSGFLKLFLPSMHLCIRVCQSCRGSLTLLWKVCCKIWLPAMSCIAIVFRMMKRSWSSIIICNWQSEMPSSGNFGSDHYPLLELNSRPILWQLTWLPNRTSESGSRLQTSRT